MTDTALGAIATPSPEAGTEPAAQATHPTRRWPPPSAWVREPCFWITNGQLADDGIIVLRVLDA